MIKTKIVLDSISGAGVRLTTFEVTFPRFVLAEFNTHRMLSRNASSSRAIPIEKVIEQIQKNPSQIVWWGKNQSGMQAKEELDAEGKAQAKTWWAMAQDKAIEYVRILANLKLHKQITNRLLEPFMNITVICTATDWSNFFALRCHEDAQPEIRELAFHMLRDYYNNIPRPIRSGEWHMPYIREEDEALPLDTKKKLSVARCARVSYLTHDGKRDIDKDLELYDRLLESGHMSPFEHVATPMSTLVGHAYSGNFRGWIQFRKTLNDEVRNWSKVPSRKQVDDYFRS